MTQVNVAPNPNVPDAYVQSLTPRTPLVSGVQTNLIGAVGSAAWGPVNAPTLFSDAGSYAAAFGSVQARKYDLGTACAAALMQGAANFNGIRVTDGTDVAASVVLGLQGTPAVNAAGTGYAINDTITGGNAAVVRVTDLQVVSATINAAGSGGTNGTATVTGTTGTGTKFQASVTISGGVITAVGSITTAGDYTIAPTSLTAEPVTGASLSGATLTLVMGVKAVSVQTQPTSQPTNPVAQTATSGTGTGASFNFTYANGLTVTSKYTGSGANADTITIGAGSAVGTTKVTTLRPGLVPAVFDNIAGSGNALWIAIANALNNGISGLRGPSGLVVATAGAATIAPTNGAYTLTGGLDGASGVTATTLVGTDGVTRTGMYALRGTGPGILLPADCDTSSTWPTIDAFCKAEGYYGIVVGPSGEYTNPATVASNKASAGVDDASLKIMVGDWCYWLDTYNGGAQRLIPPTGFMAGMLASLGPEQSSLNKEIVGIIATQKSASNTRYGQAELSIFGAAQLDLIANPSPGGNYFGGRFGQNASSNAAISGDNYSRMVPFLEYSFATTAGQVVGEVQTADLRTEVTASLDAFLYGLWTEGTISNPQGTQPYSVTCDNTNNPPNRVALGYLQVDVKVQLGPIVRIFVLNVEAGQTVQVTSQLAA